MRKTIAVASIILLAGTAFAGFTATNAGPINSAAAVGSVENGGFAYNFAGPDFVPGTLTFAGTLDKVISGTWASEARWRITNPAGQAVTFQPTGTTSYTGPLAVGPVSAGGLQGFFTGTSVGNWAFDAYESYDDGAGADSIWTNVSFQFDDYVPDTDEADFLAQVLPNYYLEDFNGYSYGSYTDPTLPLGPVNGFGYTISAVGTGSNNLYSGDGNMSTDSALDSLRIDFTGDPVTAIGGWFYAGDINGNYIVNDVIIALSDGTTTTLSPTGADDFAYFLSPGNPILWMQIDAPITAANAWPTVDHFYVGQVIPEPASLILLALAGLALRRR
jgi:hypothetical protein